MNQIADKPETKTSDQLNGNHDTDIELFRALAGDSDANSLNDFIHQIHSDGPNSILLSPSSDKLHRTVLN